jgi:hypothetical protein
MVADNSPLPAISFRIHNKLNPNLTYEPTQRNPRSIQRKGMDAGNILSHPNGQCTTNKIGCETNPTEKMHKL